MSALRDPVQQGVLHERLTHATSDPIESEVGTPVPTHVDDEEDETAPRAFAKAYELDVDELGAA